MVDMVTEPICLITAFSDNEIIAYDPSIYVPLFVLLTLDTKNSPHLKFVL
jgi:hypothetical protein